jgi:predicted GTPase
MLQRTAPVALLVGAHGAGKSSLLATLCAALHVPALEAARGAGPDAPQEESEEVRRTVPRRA